MKPIPVNTPAINAADRQAILACLESGWISSEGPQVAEFETIFAEAFGRDHGIAVSSGTAGLDIAVRALGLGPGDDVLVPSMTIISCAQAIVSSGAKPVPVDCDPLDWNAHLFHFQQRRTERTRAIMLVHLYGLCADLDPILSWARETGLAVIEDASQAHGLTYKNRPCGAFGDISVFSLYANKLITTGEGGLIVCDAEALAGKCRRLRNLCFDPEKRFWHEELGWNYRITALQAALGIPQVRRLLELVRRKRALGRAYYDAFHGIEHLQIAPLATPYCENVYWVFGVVVAPGAPFSRAELMAALGKDGIGTRTFFYGLHQQPALLRHGLIEPVSLPVTESLAERGLYLPSGLGLSDEDQQRVIRAVKTFVSAPSTAQEQPSAPATAAFDQYAAWYNAFNSDKDYASEARNVLEKVKPWQPAPKYWLDIGCGTGNHLAFLQSHGIQVEGVDVSPAMIAQARTAHPRIPFHVAPAQGFRLHGERDVISMLFHVLSYQTTDSAVAETVENVAAHLAARGVLVFDFWHSPAVLRDPPGVRVREARVGDRRLFRIARPTEDHKLRRVDIRYEFRWDAPDGPMVHEENHSMRHFTAEELATFLERAGLHVLACEGWMTNCALQPTDWYGLICARK